MLLPFEERHHGVGDEYNFNLTYQRPIDIIQIARRLRLNLVSCL